MNARLTRPLCALAIIATACGQQEPPQNAGAGWPHIPLNQQEAALADREIQIVPTEIGANGATFQLYGDNLLEARAIEGRLTVNGVLWGDSRAYETPDGVMLQFDAAGSSVGPVVLEAVVDGVTYSFRWQLPGGPVPS